MNGFRATRVEMELNFIEYVIVVTHRELWQNAGPILQSKADLASFSLEVSKRLGLRYEQPPKPLFGLIDTGSVRILSYKAYHITTRIGELLFFQEF